MFVFIRCAPSWYDGISTFHVSGEDRIYKHVLDRVEGGQDKVQADSSISFTTFLLHLSHHHQAVETLRDRLKKLKPVAEPLSPAL